MTTYYNPYYYPNYQRPEISYFSGENVDGWLYELECFFYRYQTAVEQKLAIATCYLAGDALEWYRQWCWDMRLSWRIGTWNNFAADLRCRFWSEPLTRPSVILESMSKTCDGIIQLLTEMKKENSVYMSDLSKLKSQVSSISTCGSSANKVGESDLNCELSAADVVSTDCEKFESASASVEIELALIDVTEMTTENILVSKVDEAAESGDDDYDLDVHLHFDLNVDVVDFTQPEVTPNHLSPGNHIVTVTETDEYVDLKEEIRSETSLGDLISSFSFCTLPVCENASVYLPSFSLAHETFNGNWCSIQLFYMAAVGPNPPWEPPDDRTRRELKLMSLPMSENDGIENISRVGKWKEAMSLLAKMEREDVFPDVVTCSSLIHGLAQFGELDEAKSVLAEMKRKEIFPNVVTYSSLINGLCQGGEFERVNDVLCEMKGCGILPNLVTYNSIIKGFCNAGNWKEADGIIRDMKMSGVSPDVITYNSLIYGFSVNGKWEEARAAFVDMEKNGVSPNVITYSSFIHGLCNAGKLDEAKGNFCKMKDSGIIPNVMTYCSMISVLCDAGSWKEAKVIFCQMVMNRVTSNVITDNAIIHGLSNGGNWDEVKSMLRVMKINGLTPDVITYSSIIRGLIICRKWEEAKHIMLGMNHKGISPDDVVICAVAEAYRETIWNKQVSHRVWLQSEVVKWEYANCGVIFPFLLPPAQPPDESLSLQEYNIWCWTKCWDLALSSIQKGLILSSNWQDQLNTNKADAKGSKEEIYSSRVKCVVKKDKPYKWVPEDDLHNVNDMIDEHSSLSVTTPFPNVEFIAGGATQNSIKFAQWMLQVPGATSFMGSIGKDKYGEEMEKNAKIASVNVLYYKDDNAPTGTCAVCIVGGDRSLVANLSAANCYKVEHLKQAENWALVEKAKYYYIAGFFLTISPQSIQLVAQHAAANNKVFSMNLSASFICEFFGDVQEKALPYMGYVFGNETEARTFSKVHGWKTDDVEEIAIKISQWPKAFGTYKRITVITQGADPVVVAGMNDMRYEYGICRFGTTFISAGFGAFLARYINNFFMFSLPRPPEMADLEDKVNFKGRGMLRTQYYLNKGV